MSELIKITPELFPAIATASMEALHQNLSGETLTAADLVRIKVPSGGSTIWVLTGAEEPEPVKSFEGVILHIAKRRGYWASATPTNELPDCYSMDLITGIGTPGGLCEKCPHNAWGSAKRAGGEASRGKACRERRLLFVLRQSQTLPDIVDVPPGSLKPLRRYLLSLPVPYCAVVTRFELQRQKSRDGIDYSQIKFSQSARLDNESLKCIAELAKAYSLLFSQAQIEPEEMEGQS